MKHRVYLEWASFGWAECGPVARVLYWVATVCAIVVAALLLVSLAHFVSIAA